MNVLLILNGPTANRGCEAILLATYDILKAAFPEATVVNSSFRDDRVGQEAYLQLPNLRHACHPAPLSPAWWRWRWAKHVNGHHYNFERFLPRADFVFSLGGDTYSLDYGSVEQYLRANDRVLAAGKRLIIWGASVGPFHDNRKIERRIADQFRRVHAVVVREARTREYLAGLGITKNVVLLPDPAFSLVAEPAPLPPDCARMLEAGAIGVNLSPLLARYRPKPREWRRDAARWLDALLTAIDAPVLLIPHVLIPGNDDAAFLADLVKSSRASSERLQLLPGHPLSSRQLKHVISKLRAFLGTRTHATIASLSTNVPTLSIGYSVKAYGINEEVFGHDRWVVDHLKLDAPGLASTMRQLLSEERAVRAELAARNTTYRMPPSQIQALLA